MCEVRTFRAKKFDIETDLFFDLSQGSLNVGLVLFLAAPRDGPSPFPGILLPLDKEHL